VLHSSVLRQLALPNQQAGSLARLRASFLPAAFVASVGAILPSPEFQTRTLPPLLHQRSNWSIGLTPHQRRSINRIGMVSGSQSPGPREGQPRSRGSRSPSPRSQYSRSHSPDRRDYSRTSRGRSPHRNGRDRSASRSLSRSRSRSPSQSRSRSNRSWSRDRSISRSPSPATRAPVRSTKVRSPARLPWHGQHLTPRVTTDCCRAPHQECQ